MFQAIFVDRGSNILIVCIFEFLFLFEVLGYIWEFVEILLRGFRGKIITKVRGDKSVALNSCSLFENNLFLDLLTRQDQINMWFELVLIKRLWFLIGFAISFTILLFNHATNN